MAAVDDLRAIAFLARTAAALDEAADDLRLERDEARARADAAHVQGTTVIVHGKLRPQEAELWETVCAAADFLRAPEAETMLRRQTLAAKIRDLGLLE